MSAFMEFNDDTFSTLYTSLKGASKNGTKNFAILKVAFATEEVALLYEKAITKHNQSFSTNVYTDSGFDLFVPENATFNSEKEAKFIDMKVKAEMVYCDVYNDQICPAAYYMYPRSSLSKTPLILANHVGIIDSGYRGSLITAFKWLRPPTSHTPHYTVESGTRLVQICHPSLCPVYIKVVSEGELSNSERGAGGFGSTGI
jgi:dUTP pyrophosphatase